MKFFMYQLISFLFLCCYSFVAASVIAPTQIPENFSLETKGVLCLDETKNLSLNGITERLAELSTTKFSMNAGLSYCYDISEKNLVTASEMSDGLVLNMYDLETGECFGECKNVDKMGPFVAMFDNNSFILLEEGKKAWLKFLKRKKFYLERFTLESPKEDLRKFTEPFKSSHIELPLKFTQLFPIETVKNVITKCIGLDENGFIYVVEFLILFNNIKKIEPIPIRFEDELFQKRFSLIAINRANKKKSEQGNVERCNEFCFRDVEGHILVGELQANDAIKFKKCSSTNASIDYFPALFDNANTRSGILFFKENIPHFRTSNGDISKHEVCPGDYEKPVKRKTDKFFNFLQKCGLIILNHKILTRFFCISIFLWYFFPKRQVLTDAGFFVLLLQTAQLLFR
jgi:hypothetical protein